MSYKVHPSVQFSMADDLTRDIKQYDSNISGGIVLGYKAEEEIVAVDTLHMRVCASKCPVVNVSLLSSEQGIYQRTFPSLSVIGYFLASNEAGVSLSHLINSATTVHTEQTKEQSDVPLLFILKSGELYIYKQHDAAHPAQAYELVSDEAEQVCMSYFNDILFTADIPKAISSVAVQEEANAELQANRKTPVQVQPLPSITEATNPYELLSMSGNCQEAEPVLYTESMVALSKAVANSTVVESQPRVWNTVMNITPSSVSKSVKVTDFML